MQSHPDSASTHPTHALMILEKSVEQNGQVIEMFKAKEKTNSTLLDILRERFGKDQESLDLTKTKVEQLESIVSDLKLENFQHMQQIKTLKKEMKDYEMYIDWGKRLKTGNHHMTEIRINKGICELSDDVSDSHYVYFQDKKKTQEHGANRKKKATLKKPYDRPATLRPSVPEPHVIYSSDDSS